MLRYGGGKKNPPRACLPGADLCVCVIRLLMLDGAGPFVCIICTLATVAQACSDGYRAAGATVSRTDAFVIAIVTLGADTDDATADGDSAALSFISAADACTEALTLGCDGATCDANVATVIIV